jgi:hypothetical protein
MGWVCWESTTGRSNEIKKREKEGKKEKKDGKNNPVGEACLFGAIRPMQGCFKEGGIKTSKGRK